ncbi:23S rRNA (adenine2030-N6)-methyltransferase [Humitalea rosea]|uniref:Ribosomal RNA large subunit methyltransferase J n=1 Tax=Humitalea rosea TaxID=990373 RepID=A0A2W7J2B0_9PROT|nr:23S rRNA (adenine(2030)-N(6))-methyltransferase RlmJ [Humitalea rosea]PZW45117.1 23S rRNA (adenine2030-N6)-methyltransferase [Humitalea rosea]
MNYRHAFHAGNFADCMKHALLGEILTALTRKPAPFAVLDTHAGRGSYDLSSEEAIRTGEWQDGIGRLLGVQEGPLIPWLAAMRAAGVPETYPGSPAQILAALREGDRLVCCEAHPEEYAALVAWSGRDPHISLHRRDAWEGLRALTPFPERRGLVLIDPPFEQPGEFERLEAGLALVNHRFRAAIQAAWYPVKHRTPVRQFHQALRDGPVRDVLDCQLWLREPTDADRLNGCGLVVVNPPWGFAEKAEAILGALLPLLSDDPGRGFAVTELVPE